MVGCGVLVACALAAGCSDVGGGGSIDADVTDASIDARPIDAAACNAVVNQGTLLAIQQVAQAAPTPAGGTILDGTYVVTASTIYTGVGGLTGPNGSMVQATSVNSAGTYQYVDEGGGTVNRSIGTFSTGATDITITQTCPDPTQLTFTRFDASATTLTIYDDRNVAAVVALTFTKL